MARPEYFWIELSNIPAKIIKGYNLEVIAKDGSIYVEINKGMYGLSRPTSKSTSQEETEHTRLPSKKTGTRPVETRMAT